MPSRLGAAVGVAVIAVTLAVAMPAADARVLEATTARPPIEVAPPVPTPSTSRDVAVRDVSPSPFPTPPTSLPGILVPSQTPAQVPSRTPSQAPTAAPGPSVPPSSGLPDFVPDQVGPDPSGESLPTPEPASLACDGPVEVVDEPGRRWDSVVIDPLRRLDADWAPADLRAVPEVGYRGRPAPRVRADVADALREMHAAAVADDARFVVVSGFRSHEEQHELWDQAVAAGTAGDDGEGGAPPDTARPGHSEHQLGTTVDVVDPSLPELVEGLVDTPAGRWLAANARSHGFVVSYPAGQSAVTCITPEPWHLRYVGPDVAAELDASGLTLREFLLGRD